MLTSFVRYLTNGTLILSVFNNYSKESVFKKIFVPSIMYSLFLIVFKIFITDNTILMVVSVLIVLGYLFFTSRFKLSNFIITYSLFMNCTLEYIHFAIFRTLSITRKFLGLEEFTYAQPYRLAVGRALLILIYAIVIFEIYRRKKIKVESIQKFSKYNTVRAFLILALCIIVYLKHNIKYTPLNEIHDLLSIVFTVFIVAFLFFISSSEKFANLIEKYEEKKVNPAIEEAKLQKGNHYSGLNFISAKFNSEMELFKDELEMIGMDKQDHGSLQIAFAAVLLNHEDSNENVPLRTRIYSYIAEILEIQPTTVESNISNALKRHWNLTDQKIRIKIEKNYDGPISEKNGAPTPREFLIYIVRKVNEKKDKTPKKSKSFNKMFFII